MVTKRARRAFLSGESDANGEGRFHFLKTPLTENPSKYGTFKFIFVFLPTWVVRHARKYATILNINMALSISRWRSNAFESGYFLAAKVTSAPIQGGGGNLIASRASSAFIEPISAFKFTIAAYSHIGIRDDFALFTLQPQGASRPAA